MEHFRINIFILLVICVSHNVCLLFNLNHLGCYKDVENDRDLNFTTDLVKPTAQSCIEECTKLFFLFAGVKNGDHCSCGNLYGRHGLGDCSVKCVDNPDEVCGGSDSNSVFKTDLIVPPPPTDLHVEETKESSLSIAWGSPRSPVNFTTEFNIYAHLNKTFDTASLSHSSKHIQLSSSSRSTTLFGLLPGSLYNVTITASSKNGEGPGFSQLFWTEIGLPDEPKAPQFVHHDGDNHGLDGGEIHVQLSPLDRNRKGPISAYRIVVIDETDPAPFHEENLFNWTMAEKEGINYWIAAELDPDWFSSNEEFVIGDGKVYNGYLNHGPLTEGRDYHVTMGVVSTMNNVTKTTYARVSHDQHAMENIVLFEFHSHEDDHDHDHDQALRKTKYVTEDRTIKVQSPKANNANESTDILAIGLSVAIAIFGLILAAVIGFYVYLRRSHPRRSESRGDIQELTTHTSSNGDVEAFSNGIIAEDTMTIQMDVLRTRTWSIPRNFLELSHEVVGRGKFGSLVKGQVNKNGRLLACNVQVVPGKILEEEEMISMASNLDLVQRYGIQKNLIHLVGLCEDKETIFVVLEEGTLSLKQVLLDSRALIHHPAYASKNNRFSSLPEESAIDIMIGIANGMDHLAKQRITHKKLCARNVFVVNNIAKIGGLGVTDYSKPGFEADLTRWSAQETFQSKSYISKCDVWSFAVLMWEVVTLGGTPYPDVKTREIAMRVSRGLRLPQTLNMSEDLYQLMLQCWQIDVDERPTFEEIAPILSDLTLQGNTHLSFGMTPGFQYEEYLPELECL